VPSKFHADRSSKGVDGRKAGLQREKMCVAGKEALKVSLSKFSRRAPSPSGVGPAVSTLVNISEPFPSS